MSAVNTYHWWWSNKDAQVDLVIDRRCCINLCEAKFYDDKFRMNASYAQALRRKKTHFREGTKTKKALFTTLITTHGAVENEHYLGIADNQLTMEDLFG